MVAPRQLAKPPIMEALVDFRIVTDQTVDQERLQSLRKELTELYPTVEEQKQFRAEFRVEAGKLMPPAAPDLSFQGLLMKSADGNKVAQFQTDGFTLNNVGLGAYIGGDALLDEALRLWSLFAEIARPNAVSRVALRYLNRLDLPLKDGEEFKRFLTAPPELPEGAPQRVSGFLSRIVGHDELGAIAIVTQKLDMGTAPQAPVILDVDVIYPQELEPTVDSLRPILQNLRDLKNRTFFSLLTEEAVKLYL